MLHKVCEICQKEFETQSGVKMYCADACYKEARRRQSKAPEQRARHARNVRNAYTRDPEKAAAIAKKTRTKCSDQRKEDLREWHRQHPGYRTEYSRKWDALHPEQKRQAGVKYYQAHKEREAARTSAYTKAHPDVLQLKNARRRALKLNAVGNWTREQFKELCEQVDYYCVYCHQKFDKLTPDHIIPLSRGGSNDIANIIPACGPCNYSKQDKTPLEYLTRFR